MQVLEHDRAHRADQHATAGRQHHLDRRSSSGPTAAPTAAAEATRNSTSAVASLSRLSPSRMVTIRRFRPIRRATAVAAIASGGATTAPSAKQAASGTCGSSAFTTKPDDGRDEQHVPDGQQQDRPQVVPERRHRGLDGGDEQQRRQDPDDHQVRVDARAPGMRNEREPEPHHDQQRSA